MKKKLTSLIRKLRNDNKLLDRIKWIGNICTYTAAVAIVISTTLSSAAWPFMLYTVANVLWLLAAVVMQDKPLMWLHIFFLILNTIGIAVRL